MENDRAWLDALTDHVPELVRGVGEAFGGLTTEEFEAEAIEFFESARLPTLGVAYNEAESLEAAAAYGWTAISIKDDWATVFA